MRVGFSSRSYSLLQGPAVHGRPGADDRGVEGPAVGQSRRSGGYWVGFLVWSAKILITFTTNLVPRRHLLLAALRADLGQAHRRHPRVQESEKDGHHRGLRYMPTLHISILKCFQSMAVMSQTFIHLK